MREHRGTYLAVAVVACAGMMLSLAERAAAAISMDWVTVGNPGNPADPLTGHGAVDQTYRIGKTEVTNAQYVEFLNAVANDDQHRLYHDSMGSRDRGGIVRSGSSGNHSYTLKNDMANKPINFVSIFDAMRFTNWMHNGQGAGGTENGAYDMSTGEEPTRSDDASFFLPTLDEWYKAAYHDPTREEGEYWLYPTRSDSMPAPANATAEGDIANQGPNVANFDMSNERMSNIDWGNQVTTVGSADDPATAVPESASYYGTFDQAGNVAEWVTNPDGLSGWRGGSFKPRSPTRRMKSTTGFGTHKVSWEFNDTGFRLAASVPEPATAVLFGLAAPLLLRRRR